MRYEDADADVELKNIENIIGSVGDDTLIGDVNDNIIEGGAGADTLDGGAGNDTLSFAGSATAVTFTFMRTATTVIDAEGYVVIDESVGGDLANDRYKNFENLLGSAHDDDLEGTHIAQTISGGQGDDTIRGLGGSDILYGGLGDDEIEGGFGRDTIWGGAGDDVIFGDEGDDTLHGDAGDDIINGGVGDDTINGGAGDDMLFGGTGADTINGGDGNDQIYGGAGADNLFGGTGNDMFTIDSATLAGGTIWDFLVGDNVINLITDQDALENKSYTDLDTLYGDFALNVVEVDSVSLLGLTKAVVFYVRNDNGSNGAEIARILNHEKDNLDLSDFAINGNRLIGDVPYFAADLADSFEEAENDTSFSEQFAVQLRTGTPTYSIEDDDSNLFQISANGTVTLQTGKGFDFEDAQSHGFTVVATVGTGTDAVTVRHAVTVTVTDVDDGPTSTTQATATVTESTTNLAHALVATTANGTVSFSLADDYDGPLEINARNELVFKANSTGFDAETHGESHVVPVIFKDDRGETRMEITFTIAAVNEAPLARNSEVNVMRDESYDFEASTFSEFFVDPEGDPFGGIKIVTLPNAAQGVLSLDNGTTKTAVTANSVLTLDGIDQLVFDIADDAAEHSYVATFTYQVRDDGGIDSAVTYTMSIRVPAAPNADDDGEYTGFTKPAVEVNGTDDADSDDGEGSPIAGTSATELVQGGALNDTITTGGGDDIVIGGYGDDMITLGDGTETVIYRFDSTNSGTATARANPAWLAVDGGDTIDDFELGVDKLLFIDIAENSEAGNRDKFLDALSVSITNPTQTSSEPTKLPSNINNITMILEGDDYTGIRFVFTTASDGAGPDQTGTPSSVTLTINFKNAIEFDDDNPNPLDQWNGEASHAFEPENYRDVFNHLFTNNTFDVTTDTTPGEVDIL